MRRALLSVVLLAAAAAPSGCGSTEEQTPTACLSGSGAYLKALERLPARVELGRGVPISSCLTKNQPGGELATVGQSMVGAAIKLNSEARARPASRAATETGFLAGAAARGASDTGGIHANLIDRLTAAARFSPGGARLPRSFESAYRSGYAAGRDHG